MVPASPQEFHAHVAMNQAPTCATASRVVTSEQQHRDVRHAMKLAQAAWQEMDLGRYRWSSGSSAATISHKLGAPVSPARSVEVPGVQKASLVLGKSVCPGRSEGMVVRCSTPALLVMCL
jgi:hypothetical protein